MRLGVYAVAALFFLSIMTVNASITVSYLNTTVILNKNTSAHVVEIFYLQVTNDSVQQYIQDRQAVNLTITDWQKVLNTDLLVQHILNANSSISGFTFQPGPIRTSPTGNLASLVFEYNVGNVTDVNQMGPRKLEYSFNDNVLNFMHIASGQALPPNTRLNILIPQGSQLVSVYPLPDDPQIGFLTSSTSPTRFAWYSSEPLAKFTLNFIVTQSLEEEVVTYLNSIYLTYKVFIYLAIIATIAIAAIYLYINVIKVK